MNRIERSVRTSGPERTRASSMTSAAAARSGPHPLSPSPSGRGGTRRLVVVLEARHVATAVAPELRLDPIHGGTVAVRSLAAVAEVGESLDRRFVALQVEARDKLGDG